MSYIEGWVVVDNADITCLCSAKACFSRVGGIGLEVGLCVGNWWFEDSRTLTIGKVRMYYKCKDNADRKAPFDSCDGLTEIFAYATAPLFLSPAIPGHYTPAKRADS